MYFGLCVVAFGKHKIGPAPKVSFCGECVCTRWIYRDRAVDAWNIALIAALFTCEVLGLSVYSTVVQGNMTNHAQSEFGLAWSTGFLLFVAVGIALKGSVRRACCAADDAFSAEGSVNDRANPRRTGSNSRTAGMGGGGVGGRMSYSGGPYSMPAGHLQPHMGRGSASAAMALPFIVDPRLEEEEAKIYAANRLANAIEEEGSGEGEPGASTSAEGAVTGGTTVDLSEAGLPTFVEADYDFAELGDTAPAGVPATGNSSGAAAWAKRYSGAGTGSASGTGPLMAGPPSSGGAPGRCVRLTGWNGWHSLPYLLLQWSVRIGSVLLSLAFFPFIAYAIAVCRTAACDPTA
jgi:hypothetical protein